MPADRVYRVFVASTSGFDSFEEPEYIYRRIFAKDRVSIEEVSNSMSMGIVPETVSSITEILQAYCGWDECIGVPEFSQLLYDLFASAPNQYSNLIKSIWGQ